MFSSFEERSRLEVKTQANVIEVLDMEESPRVYGLKGKEGRRWEPRKTSPIKGSDMGRS